MNLKVGDAAPDFTLYSSDKQLISLTDFKNKTLLILFFPLAFTSVCTKELCNVRDNIGMYNNTDANVIGISVDSPQTLAKFKEDQHLNFLLLSDFNKEVSQKYGCLYETYAMGMKGVSKRSAFIIGPDEKIKYQEVLENAGEEPNYKVILEVLHNA